MMGIHDQITNLTITEAILAIRRKELTPVDLIKGCLDLIAKNNVHINAFITIMSEEAEKQAQMETEKIHKLGKIKSLSGIPIGLKDVFDVEGIPTTSGSLITKKAKSNSFVTEKLIEAGAIIIGKNNMNEFALGATGRNYHFGPVHNPWNIEYLSGGSSSGSAASVASGFCLGALGSDSAGSVRIPAAFCGVVGFKPTFGSISRRGMFPLSWSLDHIGILGRSVEDVCLLYNVICEPDPLVYTSTKKYYKSSPPIKLSPDGIDLTGLKIGVPQNFFFDDLDSDIKTMTYNAIRDLEILGAITTRIDLPNVKEAIDAQNVIMYSDAASHHEERLLKSPEIFSREVFERLNQGLSYRAIDYSNAKQVQGKWQLYFYNLFKNIDIIIVPTTQYQAPNINDQQKNRNPLINFTRLFNMTGNPSISLPCGISSKGIPIGFQMISDNWNEKHLLEIANTYEITYPWIRMSPNRF